MFDQIYWVYDPITDIRDEDPNFEGTCDKMLYLLSFSDKAFVLMGQVVVILMTMKCNFLSKRIDEDD